MAWRMLLFSLAVLIHVFDIFAFSLALLPCFISALLCVFVFVVSLAVVKGGGSCGQVWRDLPVIQ